MENEIENTPNEIAVGPAEAETVQSETKTDCDINRACADIMNDFMRIEQESLNRQNELIQRLQCMCNDCGREDIAEAIQDLKDHVVGDETEHWDLAKGWYEFFAGINTDINKDEVEVYGEPETDDEDEPKNNNTEE